MKSRSRIGFVVAFALSLLLFFVSSGGSRKNKRRLQKVLTVHNIKIDWGKCLGLKILLVRFILFLAEVSSCAELELLGLRLFVQRLRGTRLMLKRGQRCDDLEYDMVEG
jgi:hypothetical protein